MNSFRINICKTEELQYTYPNAKFDIVCAILSQAPGEIKPFFFYEPYIEISWISDQERLSDSFAAEVKESLAKLKIKDVEYLKKENGKYGDWYACSEDERKFGAKVHRLCTEYVLLYHQYKSSVDKGKGLRKQVERTIHRLCNPLGIDYKEEAKICFSRGLICWLFTIFSFERAVWIYKNIFRQKY